MKDLEGNEVVCPKCESERITKFNLGKKLVSMGFYFIIVGLFTTICIITIPITIMMWIVSLCCFLIYPFFINKYMYSCVSCRHMWGC